jgi:hypothetical protein
MPVQYSHDDLARFFAKVGPDRKWVAKCDRYGYGVFYAQGHYLSAHRVAWEVANGRAVPEGMHILHSCHEPSCVDPDHLRPGTHADNMADKAARWGYHYPRLPRGLTPRPSGSQSHLAKLVESQVREIRELYARGGITQRAIAIRYGMSRAEIWSILHRKRWRQI